MYEISKLGNVIIRTADSAWIPVDAMNKDYQEFLEWQAAGGVSKDYVDPPAAVEKDTKDKIVKAQVEILPILIECIFIFLSEDKTKIKDAKDKLDAKIASSGITVADLTKP